MSSDLVPVVLLLAAFPIAAWLVSPIVIEARALIVKRRLRRRLHQDHVDWIERRKQYAREALR